MRLNRETFIIGFALFSMFFGAGNLIFPPTLGFKAGASWQWVTLGFVISAVILPLLGIFAHARLQGTMMDFAKKVSPIFSLIYSCIVYAISIALPSPRTASVTHEIAIAPFLGTSSLITSSIYFIFVLLFVLNRSKILNILGKWLTPLIFITVLSIIGIGIFVKSSSISLGRFQTPFVSGMLEGYQTFDTIGAVVVGAVLIISIQLKGHYRFQEKKALIRNAGMVAGIGLLIVYTGLIYCGALFKSDFPADIERTALLTGISKSTLGKLGNVFLSVLISLACFTTAVGIITGTADFVKGLFNQSKTAYKITAFISCLLGIGIGQLDVHHIVMIAVPVLMFIYPITIVLILLNIVPDRFTPPKVFKAVVLVTIIFSIPDFANSIGFETAKNILEYIPLGTYSIGWLLPALLTFLITNLMFRKH